MFKNIEELRKGIELWIDQAKVGLWQDAAVKDFDVFKLLPQTILIGYGPVGTESLRKPSVFIDLPDKIPFEEIFELDDLYQVFLHLIQYDSEIYQPYGFEASYITITLNREMARLFTRPSRISSAIVNAAARDGEKFALKAFKRQLTDYMRDILSYTRAMYMLLSEDIEPELPELPQDFIVKTSIPVPAPVPENKKATMTPDLANKWANLV